MATAKDTPERETATVVMGRDLASMVKVIAGHRGLTMAETWDKYGRPALVKEYRKVIQEMDAELGGSD